MKFKTYTPYTLDNDARLSSLFTQLPNGFINKGWCGNGATTLEIKNIFRSSIITVPNVTIVKDKGEQYPAALTIYEGITIIEVKAFLIKGELGQKIITTPEGIVKIMEAASRLGMVQEIYGAWFLMLDEGHSFISEFYRENILAPFDHFYRFTNKCIISATPYYFTDPKMAELDYIEIKPARSLGKINMVEAISIQGTLKHLIDHAVQTKNKLFIFYNSVKEIASLVKLCDLTDCQIYCANDRAGLNMKTLNELSPMHRLQPKNGNFALVNFFTTTAFEGWDLIQEKATMVVVTDIHKSHTLVGIDKCFQAFGRWRKQEDSREIPMLYHVFNHRKDQNFKPITQFIEHYSAESKRLLNNYINGARSSIANGMKPTYDKSLERFAREPKSSNPELDYNMLDQVINEEYNKEVYNHFSYIRLAWESYHYQTSHTKSDHFLPNSRDEKRESSSDRLKRDYQAIQTFKMNTDIFYIGVDPADTIKHTNNLAYEASSYLNEKEMENAGYNVKRVKTAVIKAKEPSLNAKIYKHVDQAFKLHIYYTAAHIKGVLQKIYEDLNYIDDSGKIIKVTASSISSYYESITEKVTGKDGKRSWFTKLIRPTFQMAVLD